MGVLYDDLLAKSSGYQDQMHAQRSYVHRCCPGMFTILSVCRQTLQFCFTHVGCCSYVSPFLELPTLEKCITLHIPQREDIQSVLDNRTYRIDNIKDLQSKLVLVAGQHVQNRDTVVGDFMTVSYLSIVHFIV